MFMKLKLIFLLILTLGLLSFNALGQNKTEEDELKRQIEITKLKNELKKQEIELQKQENELKKLREATKGSINAETVTRNGSGTESPNNPPPTGPQQPAPSIENSQTPTPVASTTGNNQPQNDCVINSLDPLSATRLKTAICIIANKIVQGNDNLFSPDLMGNQIADVLAAKLAPKEADRSFFIDSEKKRTDKQIGSTPSSAGTTSLAVKGGTPAIIGWAVEQGAATSSFSGNTVTVRINPLNLGKALFYNQGILEIKDVKPREDAFDTFLKKLSLGLSFDTSRGTDKPVFIGNSQQLSAFSFRYEFINHRNPLSPEHKAARENFFFSQKENLDKIARSILSLVVRGQDKFKNDDLNKWLDETNRELQKIAPDLSKAERRAQITAVIESRLEKLSFDQLSKDSDVKAAMQSFAEGSIGFKQARDKLIDDINDGAIATFEYTNNREPIAPDTSNFRFIWEKGIFRNTDFTFNSSLTMYNKKPTVPSVRRIRDFQFALQTDTRIGDRFGTGDIFLSFAGKYERLNSDTVDALGVVKPGTKGDIALGQLKLTIPIADWGIKLPLSLTFANRTELIKESTVRANFGITFDLDPLFARFKPF